MAEIQTYYFEDGNTARNLAEIMPDREERERRQREMEYRRRKAQERRKRNAMRKNRLYTLYLSMAVVACCLFLVAYVGLQNDISTSMKSISNLETEISDLKASNKATEARINIDMNLSQVKYAAVLNLGMVYATSDQIVYYDMDNSDYMSQYADIP